MIAMRCDTLARMKQLILILLMIIGLPIKVNAAEKILLVPLDSRPFCSKTVVDAARIGSIEVITPPHELTDFFTIAGDVDGLRSWTLEHIGEFDAAILSIDQLTSGGLMASREKILSDVEIDRLIEFLIELRERAPTIKLYAFSILPRHLPPSTIENYHQRRALIEYAGLLSRRPTEVEALVELERLIAVENKKLYFDRFRRSEELNRRLIALTVDGVIDRLWIGSDDSERFSPQNDLARRLTRDVVDDRVTLTHGADELALMMLARHVIGARRLRVKVEYNDRSSAYRVMPYMSATVGAVAVEKIKALGGAVVDGDEDFVLMVSVNSSDKKTRPARRALADEIGLRIGRRERLALVDLSEHFSADETLMPVLIDRGVAINGLPAYSSFNTTSNAIGCALSEAAIVTVSLDRLEPREVLRSNVEFLTARVIEDEFYLKEAIDAVNGALRRLGREPAWLDSGFEFDWATTVMRLVMSKKVERYERSSAFLAPVEFETPTGLIRLRAVGLRAEYRFPWFRTFEIELKSVNQLEFVGDDGIMSDDD